MLSQLTQVLIQKYQNWHQSLQLKSGAPTIHVDEVASKVASFYEKIRGVVDWREEHLLRRAAIERILKRRLFLQANAEGLAESFVYELIRGGHFPNDRIEEAKIDEVKETLNKYLFILQNSPSLPKDKEKLHLSDWLLGICACEVEEILCPPLREESLIDCMTDSMKEKIEVIERNPLDKKITDQEKENQIYIAVQRALFKLDAPIISYYLIKKKYPDWQKLSVPRLKEIAKDIHLLREEVERELNHPLSEKFYRICERYDTPYLILGDIISQNPTGAQGNLSQPEALENQIKGAYQKRYSKLKSRLARAAIYSTVSIFITKMLLAFAIEVPFDKYILGEFNFRTLGLNILIPPLLMFFLVLTIRPPKRENLDQVIIETMKIVYEKDKKDVYPIKHGRKRGFVSNFLITAFYLLTFLISFGVIIWGLRKLEFGIISIIIFLMFFSLISCAGVKIRERAKELQVAPDRTGFLGFLVDSFSLPFLRVGRWLSNQWARHNVVLVLMTAIIDMPFQLFAEFLEQWRTFLREKREEIH